ncbi:ATP-sensitive inward rectifier potassium channel 12-like isoform X3 [Portunus trituberculatus]|uniref:ATP-sensitive inward rectifier potassium channel 12-like isoform X3 n=1 Tax=Portunus trituberculatus TaxID=210409 RepID=UPI001E1CB4CA|nr:ATP-sensitive inward rectifier potassium channel 12-like isoform X3 [Portunus trituberculatus]
MKVSGGEGAGPAGPVWQTLKGLSSRESSCGSPTSPGPQQQQQLQQQQRGLQSSNAVAERLARRDSCPLDASSSSSRPKEVTLPHLILPEGDRSPVLYNGSVATPVSAPPITASGDVGGRTPWGPPSSSTTSTSLSNTNLTLHKNAAVTPNNMLLTNNNIGNATTTSPKDDETPTADTPEAETPSVFRYRHTRISSKKMRKRVVQKNGECNVSPSNVAKRRRRYLQDIFTTLVDIQWRWTLLVFAMSFISSWLLFALVWWVIAYLHGDLLPHHLPDQQAASNWTPCVMSIFSFTSCFLFSVETQHTIGYGSRHTTEKCPEAIFVMCIQSITGVMIQAFMVGIVFAKLSRPKKRTQTLMFSRNACLCLRDGEMCMLFRVGDMRKSHIIEAHVRAQLIRKRVTLEGEVLPFFQYELDVGYDIGEDRIFFIWPMTIIHKINENSPLFDLSAHDLLREKFEIVVILEGVIESTGMTTQARSSYLPNEILWGYRFEPLVTFNKEFGEYAVDYSLFNNVYQVNTPLYSARELARLNSQESTPEREGENSRSSSRQQQIGQKEEEEEEGEDEDDQETSSIIPVTPLTPATPMSPLTPMTPTSASGTGSCALDMHCASAACEDANATQPLLQDHNHV